MEAQVALRMRGNRRARLPRACAWEACLTHETHETQEPVDTPRRSLAALLLSGLFGRAAAVPAQPPAIAAPVHRVGIVLLHGIGATGESMAPLADRLREPGWRVRTPDLPYGGPRAFSQPVTAAESTVREALQALRREGATRLVLAGFSLGGLFAAHMAGREAVDALVAIAPNGGSDMKPLADQLARARERIATGRGDEPAVLQDSDVVSPARYELPHAVPSAYVSWFDPQGAMNWKGVWSRLRPGTPVLLVVPTRDLANLRKVKRELWQGLPPHPANRLYEPRADHLGAPLASADEAVRWIRETVEAEAAR